MGLFWKHAITMPGPPFVGCTYFAPVNYMLWLKCLAGGETGTAAGTTLTGPEASVPDSERLSRMAISTNPNPTTIATRMSGPFISVVNCRGK
jgi:hypothetical protein